jgi:hypothetical protein
MCGESVAKHGSFRWAMEVDAGFLGSSGHRASLSARLIGRTKKGGANKFGR